MRGYWKQRKKRQRSWAVVLFLFALGGSLLLAARWHRNDASNPEDWEMAVPEAVEMAEEESVITPLASGDLKALLEQQGAGWVVDPALLEEGKKTLSGELSYRYARETSCDLPRVAIVVDDVGYNTAMARKLAEISVPLTWAIIPGLKSTRPCRRWRTKRGFPTWYTCPCRPRATKRAIAGTT